MKQYNPKKSKRWGYKIFILSDSRGLVYNFEMYTGKTLPWNGFPDIGASGNIALSLSSIIPGNMSHKLYPDNWFTSVDLQVIQERRKIHCVGTVMSNRLPGCNFTSDKDMKKKSRGAFEEKETAINGIPLRAVRWFDNRAITLISTFASANPTAIVERWDKKKKALVLVKWPSNVNTYNKGMGGVDLLDSLIALYRTKIRSKKWFKGLCSTCSISPSLRPGSFTGETVETVVSVVSPQSGSAAWLNSRRRLQVVSAEKGQPEEKGKTMTRRAEKLEKRQGPYTTTLNAEHCKWMRSGT